MVSYIALSFAKNFLSRSTGTGRRKWATGNPCRGLVYSIRGSCGWCWVWDFNIISADEFFSLKRTGRFYYKQPCFPSDTSCWPPFLSKTYSRVHFPQIHCAAPPVPSTLLPCCSYYALVSFHSFLWSHPFRSISFLHSFWFFNSLISWDYASAAQVLPLDKKRVQLHAPMAKAKSSLATQTRAEKIDLATFLHRCKVSGLATAAYRCTAGLERRETAKNILMLYRWNDIKKLILNVRLTADYH